MTGIEIHGNVGQVELLERVCNTLTVAGSGSLACGEVDVGDKVGKGVGLDDQRDSNLGVLLDDSNNGCRCQWVSYLTCG